MTVDAADEALETLEAYCTTKQYGVLADFNTWVDVLLPERDGDSESLREARMAVEVATIGASAMTRDAIVSWSSRFTSPKHLAIWISETEAMFERLLTSMYASRNMTMHSGVFATRGDAVLGRGAELVVDLLMEVLGNWYRHRQTAEATAADAPRSLIRDLASRSAYLRSMMESAAGPAYELNVAWLTGPGSLTGWDR